MQRVACPGLDAAVRPRGLVGLLALASTLPGCGFDGLFLTPRGYDPTPPPRVVLVGETGGPAQLSVLSAEGVVLASQAVTGAGEVELLLPPGTQGRALRVYARQGSRTTKTLVAEAALGELTPFGRLDARTTAVTQLALYEIEGEAGSTLAATPPAALRSLLRAMGQTPTESLDALVALVDGALERAPTDGSGAPLFEPLGYAISPAEDTDAYREALIAAARDYGLQIRCDPSRLNVMFAVDLSGQARDGNGAPQLIRQPPKTDRVFLGFTADETSPVAGDGIPTKLIPNDAAYAMVDDGRGGDELAGDRVYTVVVPLPRGARLLYKYTDGAAGEGFTGAEEWPGNARILEVEDVLSGRPDGEADCVVVRRDAFGDEASNKNFVNLNARARAAGGTVRFDADLGGDERSAAASGLRLGGLDRLALRSGPGLTPAGVPEARENGVCSPCPAPIVLDPEDATPPVLLSAVRTAVDRVRVRFSEPIAAADARDVGKLQLLDEAGRAVGLRAARAAGSDVLVDTDPAHPTLPFRLLVRDLGDVSARRNVLEAAEIAVGPDVTPPTLVAVRARSRLDVEPGARLPDPTVGEIVEVTLDELPEASAASDPARFVIPGLEVRAATLVAGAAAPTVRLVTAVQRAGQAYTLTIRGLRDPAGNAADQTLGFTGFALYHVTFSVVPGFALVSADGAQRGLPRGEKLYLTGTPLLAARALDGRSLSIEAQGGLRTDVTGYPDFELKPSGRSFAVGDRSAPIYELDVLLPPGSWAWKPAHGVEGEFARAPTTLEKVAKVLATANDATGVRVDPTTLIAANGLDYTGARLSLSGEDPPRRGVVFKRETPDEVCDVRARDLGCPLVVVGTWRDAVDQIADYDDGIVALPLHRPELPDYAAPKLLDARARDSHSILLSFDEALATPLSRVEVSVARATDGVGLRATVVDGDALPPHQLVLTVDGRLEPGAPYVVRYRGATDRATPPHVDRTARTATVLAPAVDTPLEPLVDTQPPRVRTTTAAEPTELVVRFNEALDPSTVRPAAFTVDTLTIEGAELLPDRTSVRLTTSRQPLFTPLRLIVQGVGDVADPANVLTSTTIGFTSFGERTPPVIVRARAIGPDRVLLRFSKAIDPTTAAAVSSYAIGGGAAIVGVVFGDDPARRGLAFSPRLAPRLRDTVVVTTSVLEPGRAFEVTAPGVQDLSGNRAVGVGIVVGVAEAPVVDVVLEVQVSDAVPVAGQIPSRALSPAAIAESREGVFAVGARADASGQVVAGRSGPVNDTLGGFPAEGQPLDGIEPRLVDDGSGGDRTAGDGVYTVVIPRVPLGTALLWKAFAPFTTRYRDRSGGDPQAAFADAPPGPSTFADGQEYPGNENGVVILDEGASAGAVRVRAVFGDEATYKKFSGSAPFMWAAGDVAPAAR